MGRVLLIKLYYPRETAETETADTYKKDIACGIFVRALVAAVITVKLGHDKTPVSTYRSIHLLL
ncbi:hypothetical protein J3R83DRAFT_10889 [Lanmaoa asiatica]|nr:hypothetical protein J3R83DRAFT_10889 [Lanmaoa asiatica]